MRGTRGLLVCVEARRRVALSRVSSQPPEMRLIGRSCSEGSQPLLGRQGGDLLPLGHTLREGLQGVY